MSTNNPTPRPRRKLWAVLAFAAVAAIAAGITGTALHNDGATAGKGALVVAAAADATVTVTAPADPASPVTVTKTAPTKTVTKTVTKTDETTPQSCLDALDDADQLISLSAQGFDAAHDGMVAALSYDSAGLDDSTARLKDITAQVQAEGVVYTADRAACESQG